jgi:hypothetical protein
MIHAMKQKYIVILSAILVSCSSENSKSVVVPKNSDTLATIHKEIVQEMPSIQAILFDTTNYSALDSAVGNLNLDNYPDKLLVLKDKVEGIATNVPRPLLILTGQADHSYKLVARNDSVVLCADCGGVFGDPYEGLTIKDGFFSVEHYGGSGWRWTRIITFKYSAAENNWHLHRDAGISYHNSDPDKTEEILTNKGDFGKLLFTDYSNEKGF